MTRAGTFGSSIEFSIVARLLGESGPTHVRVASAVTEDVPVLDLVPAPGGWHRLHRSASLENASLLDGILTLVPESGMPAERRPRRVVPMRRDETLGLFIEVERVHLAEDSIVIAADGVAAAVHDALEEAARPGFRRVNDGLLGLPSGWVAFLGVQVFGLPSSAAKPGGPSDLNVLLPSVASQITLAGGLKLPGHMRKYSSGAPPEVRAVAVGAEKIRVKVMRKPTDELGLLDDLANVAVDQVVHDSQADASAIVVPLTPGQLEDGDYEALLFINASMNPAQRLPFWLRSGGSHDLLMWSRSKRLIYDVTKEGGWAALSADEYTGGPVTTMVDGAVAQGESERAQPTPAGHSIWWTAKRPLGHSVPAPVFLTTPDPTSCLVTGAHRWELPYAKTLTVTGICRRCGLVKRFPNSPWAASTRKDRGAAAYRIDIGALVPVSARSLNWDVALDALMHAGGGSFASLERVALQVEGSSLFVDRFVRTLEVLAHVAVQRDPYTMQPVEWRISPAELAELPNGDLLLVGFWPAARRHRLAEEVAARGGNLVSETSSGQPTRRAVTGVSAATAADIANAMKVTMGRDAARSVLRATPVLSAVEAGLPRVSLPGARRLRRFDVPSASWVAVPHAHLPGAYRLESFRSVDVVRRPDDIAGGTARVGTVQLIKHLEALRMGRPLVAYDPQDRRLMAPLGADLPGLYGRAVVLCSGWPPLPDERRRLLVYRDVPGDIADMLAGRLAR